MDVVQLDEQTQKLITFSGYFEKFYLLKFENPHTTDLGVYIMLEELYLSVFGTNKYTSFQSFKTSKYRYCRSLQEAKR